MTAAVKDTIAEALVVVLRPLVLDCVREALAEIHDAAPVKREVLSREEVAFALGCSTATVSRLRRAGMPVVMVLDTAKFRLADVLHWLQSRGDSATQPQALACTEVDTERKAELPHD